MTTNRLTSVVAVLALGLTVSSCGSSAKAPSASPTNALSQSSDPAISPTPTPAPKPKPKPPSIFPKGYPQIVLVSSLPEQVRSWYQMSPGYKKAIAIAPGVWQPLSPGMTLSDADPTNGIDGFCGSVKVYTKKFLHGQEQGGSCW